MERFFGWVTRHPLAVILVIIGLTAAAGYQARSGSRMETDLDEYMPADHPAFVYSDQAAEWFDIQDGIVIAVESPDGVYTPETLQKIKDLTRELQQDPDIEKADVTSLYTADNIVGSDAGLDVKRFYKRTPTSQKKIERLREQVQTNDMVRGRLVSEDETVAVIIARIEDDVFSQDFYERIVTLAETFEGPETIHVAGRPIVEGTLAHLAPKDMQRMVPAVVLIILLVLYLVLRGVRSTAMTFLVVAISTIGSFGLMAALGIPIYSVTTMMPVMLIAIGVADGIHLYNHLALFRDAHPDVPVKDAVLDMTRQMWRPVAMTSVTTAVGFLSLLTSDVYPIKYFGLFTAFGVLLAMVLSMTLIPAATVLLGAKAGKPTEKGKGAAGETSRRVTGGILRSRKAILVSTVIILALSVFGASRIWINSSFLDKFERDSDIVQTDAFVNEHFGGTTTLNVVLEAGTEGAFKSPEILREVQQMQAEVEGQELVGSSFSLVDYLRRMNRVMNEDREEFDTVPGTSDLVAQYLLLYEMSGDPENLWRVVNYGYDRLNVTFQLKRDDSRTMNAAIADIETHRPRLAELGVEINYAGSGYKALVFTDLILEGQVKSILLSVLIVIILLALMFRRLRFGLIGAVPIVLTAAIGFGVMGLLDIPLSTTTALLASITIGIGIDYAVHFIDRYRVNLARTGPGLETMAATMRHSGRAILFNAVVVVSGFLVLLLSAFPPNRALGALIALGMFVSFVATVTVMVHLLKGGEK
jgi:uncharacterized protein